MGNSISFIPLIIGIALCLFGWTLYWTGVSLSGALFGASFAGSICLLLEIFVNFNDTTFLIIFIIFVTIGAFLGISVFKQIHRLSFFLFGAVLGLIISESIKKIAENHELFSLETDLSLVILKVICAIVIGIIVVFLSKYIISIITSGVGTYLILYSINFKYMEYLIFPILIISIIIQTGFLKYFKKESKD